MDQINSNPSLHYAKLYQQLNSPAAKPQAFAPSEATTPAQSKPVEKPTDYSSMFADDQLAKLQHNLEAISNFAETALKRFDS